MLTTRQSDTADHFFEDPYARRRRILLHPRRDDVSPPAFTEGLDLSPQRTPCRRGDRSCWAGMLQLFGRDRGRGYKTKRRTKRHKKCKRRTNRRTVRRPARRTKCRKKCRTARRTKCRTKCRKKRRR